jgi:hypothetical protein
MYLHEAMRQPDWEQFIEAMKKEVADHTNNNNWSVVHHSDSYRNSNSPCRMVYEADEMENRHMRSL